jgi:hypothetical protein
VKDSEYLEAVLREQTLAPGGPELIALQNNRKNVEGLLREKLGAYSPTIRYGGSKAKGTMIKEAYDLDIACHFPVDETGAGETLEDIYNNAAGVLGEHYFIERRSSAIRLHGMERGVRGSDLHVDVVPGRFFDDSETDVWLHQNSPQKKRLKTNLDVHIQHVRDSGVVDAIQLMKLLRVRRHIAMRIFILELLVIDLLAQHKQAALPAQLRHVLEQFRDTADDLAVEDPANPTGNDLSDLLNATVKVQLSSAAEWTLREVDNGGWERVFGPVPEEDETAALKRVAVSLPAAARQRPWLGDQ